MTSIPGPWNNPATVSRALEETASLLRALQERSQPPARLLQRWEDTPIPMRRDQVESALADYIAQQGAPPLDAAWSSRLPKGLLADLSGSLLHWSVRQAARQPGAPPGRLGERPTLSPFQARIFANAWALWPQNPALQTPGWAARTREWLAACGVDLGQVALLLDETGDSELARDTAGRWLRRLRPDGEIHRLLDAMLVRPALREAGEAGLRRAIQWHAGRPELLLPLCHLAHEVGCWGCALEAADRLLPQLDPSGPARQVDAVRIAALACLGHRDAAITGYVRAWFSETDPFPYPAPLLALLDGVEHREIRAYLLEHCLDGASWVRLERMDARGEYLATLPEWARLWNEEFESVYLLLRMTGALLAVPPAARQPYVESVRRRWEEILEWIATLDQQTPDTIRLRESAHSALLLLTESRSARVALYRAHLSGASLDHDLPVRATRDYIRTQVEDRQWTALVEFFERREAPLLRHACTYEEYQLFRLLARLERLPQAAAEVEAWCRLWEEVAGLPLPERDLAAALEHFNRSRALLARARPNQATGPLRDVELQLLRRGKAAGERLLLAWKAPAAELESYRTALAAARIEGLPRLIEDLVRFVEIQQ